MKSSLLWIPLLAVSVSCSSNIRIQDSKSDQQILMPSRLWSLCGDPSTHLLRPVDGGVSISPEVPMVGRDIKIVVKGELDEEVTSGSVSADLRVSLFRVKKVLDFCDALNSGFLQGASCPMQPGLVTLTAETVIPQDAPKFPIAGDIEIKDQDGRTLTCVHVDFQLQ